VKAVNLIPVEQRAQRGGVANRSHGVAYVLAAVPVAVGALGGLYGLAKHELASKETEAARVEKLAERTQREAAGLAPYKSFIALRQSRESQILGLINSRFDWAHLLAELGAVLPQGTTVSTFQGAIGTSAGASTTTTKASSGGAVASATPAGSLPTVILSGCATSGTTVALLLSRLKLIDGVSNVEMHSLQRNGAGSSAGSSSGACPAGTQSYNVTITFEALPTPPTSAPAPATSSATAPATSHRTSARPASGHALPAAENRKVLPR